MIDGYRRWLRAKYDTVAALSAAWRRPLASFEEAHPPARLEAASRDDLPALLEWLAFADSRIPPEDHRGALDYLDDVMPAWSAGGDADPLYHRVRIAARELCGTGAFPSAGNACRDVLPPGTGPDATDFALRAALMHGAATDPVPNNADTGGLAPLLALLRAAPWQADRKLLILYPRVCAHLKQVAEKSRPAANDQPAFGFERAIQTAGPQLLKKIIDLTARARFPFAVGDTRVPLEVMGGYPLVICPTLEVLSGGAAVKLERYVTGGGFLAIGPRIPVMDETMRRDDTLARHFAQGLSEFALEVVHAGRGAFLTLPGHVSAATIEFLAFESGLARGLTADAPGIDSAVHRSGARRLLWVANPTHSVAEATMSGEPVSELRSVATGERRPARSTLPIPPGSVTAWEVF